MLNQRALCHFAVACALWAGVVAGASSAAAQTPAATPAAAPQAAPALPPPGSPPLVRFIELAFPTQGNVSGIEPETYLYYIQTKPSSPSAGRWESYNEQTVLDDFHRLWNTNFLADLKIDVKDAPYDNGVIGKHITYLMEERERVKIVDYEGTKAIQQTKIDEALREKGIQIRLDSFIDQGLVRRVAGVVHDLMAEKGYQDATVVPESTPMPGGPKLVHLTFRITEGPKVKIGRVQFIGNQAFGNGTLKRRLKNNKGPGFFAIFARGGTYQEAKFEEDAERVVEYYRERGYIEIKVGQPVLTRLRDSSDGKTRWMQLGIPVTEGQRYRIGEFAFDGNKVVKSENLRTLFKQETGDVYNEKKVREGLQKAREIYGAAGYFEFTGYPDLKPADPVPVAAATPRRRSPVPVVDVTMRVQEGKRYFVNRINFVGNLTTRDNVIRREVRLFENGVFDTEALKNSVRRLNQLGYFKELQEQRDLVIDKTPGVDNKVDVTLKLEEQNRNQLTFGAGVSQYDGVFGQLSFQTANFMGRGESLTLSLQTGSRARNYEIAFTEPFLFDRPITGGINFYRRAVSYPDQYTQQSSGGNVTMGFPLANFTRMYLNYSLERVAVTELNEVYYDPITLANNPYLRDALLVGQGGRRTIGKITPSAVMNTVDNPITPTTGRRYTASLALAGIGGDTNYYKPSLEGIWYLRQSARTSVGLRGMFEFITPLGSTTVLPMFERLFLGGGYSVRGYDLRSIGPRDSLSGLVYGGNKSLLFNAEYLIAVAGPVRLVLFYDAGQVQDDGQRFSREDFVTSTGAEIRFFMPVLNVPFRLIFAYNPQRDAVLDDNMQPARKFRFRFDVGSTF